MRILHVGKFYPPVAGGMERMLQVLCECERPAVDSRVLVANTRFATVQEEVNGVPVTRLARWGQIGAVGVCPSLPVWLRREDSDITVIHEPNPVALIGALLARPAGRLLVWFHSEVVRPAWQYRLFYRPFLRAVLRRADRIIVSSPRLAEHAVELQDFRSKCAVIPFGVDASRFAKTEAIAARAAAFRETHGGPLALFVGRFVAYKGISVLLRALVGVDVRAVLVGDGPLKTDLQTLARELQIEERVSFLGEVTEQDLLALYHASDFFVLPSVTRAEAFGVVQLEAMACGKPVISTDVASGVPWVNQHGRTGLVVPPGETEPLREAIVYLAGRRDIREAWGRYARERLEREFTIGRMGDRTRALYLEVLGHASGGGATAPVHRASRSADGPASVRTGSERSRA